ncbi:hypothetical protein [Alcaligenes faecalis]|jgi:uncharacterized membrane protein (UPF0182 family)|uniref:hypothetical protein n=1 Tax=Alcaligenes faecalis TaxID=511 RepID=UPI0005A9BD41|nr:hypothetical protein [Alcaligenes faecalis]ATH99554.1 hypothetical protein CPY64_07355 [Alcaligenes faecalis]AYZ92341.1 hypothetical protein EGY22_13125 [Alcaligenes faecalis]MCX5593079.1 hypothetical protein [Alcaligenes faecalis]QQC31860.1 hypothetical protein I6H81_14565 [Alcaligenes faecalis]CAJ0903395.1 Transmembrane protein [Alcaligenes faecalis subsp. faecalis]
MRAIVYLALGLAGLGMLIAAWVYGQAIPFAEQWPLYEALRNTAAIIFAVVGAWLAIIYPDRLRLSFRESEREAESVSNLSLLLTPAIMSTGILVILLLVGVIAPMLRQVELLYSYLPVMRGASFVLLVFLTLWQVVIVVIAIIPADLLLGKEAEDKVKHKVQNSYGQLHKRATGKAKDAEG